MQKSLQISHLKAFNFLLNYAVFLAGYGGRSSNQFAEDLSNIYAFVSEILTLNPIDRDMESNNSTSSKILKAKRAKITLPHLQMQGFSNLPSSRLD